MFGCVARTGWDIPVVIVAANDWTTEDRTDGYENALAVGCTDFDTKPIEQPRLIQKIHVLAPRPAS
jgi:CheY-like chemotaxis protein